MNECWERERERERGKAPAVWISHAWMLTHQTKQTHMLHGRACGCVYTWLWYTLYHKEGSVPNQPCVGSSLPLSPSPTTLSLSISHPSLPPSLSFSLPLRLTCIIRTWHIRLESTYSPNPIEELLQYNMSEHESEKVIISFFRVWNWLGEPGTYLKEPSWDINQSSSN